MRYSLEDLNRWLKEPESECLEFKEAKSKFEFDRLLKYCAALANEGGGKMILGVSERGRAALSALLLSRNRGRPFRIWNIGCI